MRLEMQYLRAFSEISSGSFAIGRQQAASAAAASGKSLPPTGAGMQARNKAIFY